MRRATWPEYFNNTWWVISIHALLAESDQQKCGDGKPHVNFYPRSPCGERHFENMVQTYLQNFYPRSPCGERLLRPSPVSVIARFLSTLSLRRATNIPLPNAHIIAISIHALLAESDCCRPRWPPQAQKFLSTLSLRRATMGSVSRYLLPRDFYPRSPCGERHSRHCPQKVILYFYPRSPCGERRVTVLGIQHRVGISIHALLAESDGLDGRFKL